MSNNADISLNNILIPNISVELIFIVKNDIVVEFFVVFAVSWELFFQGFKMDVLVDDFVDLAFNSDFFEVEEEGRENTLVKKLDVDGGVFFDIFIKISKNGEIENLVFS
ncbi:5859_t:CDS:1 [Funneliformis geosporum]|uniref:19662_t:CDS:1 n=1 Tax=Funneliformis geosporum TaxID=1117311 RepID=A0A9W4T0U8_9GLOM|nr:5859_t:CDS:1 [Funneliformis geosporum]CAI2188060.1 19662_t:CDS:1 [Funneliformis geosporum]